MERSLLVYLNMLGENHRLAPRIAVNTFAQLLSPVSSVLLPVLNLAEGGLFLRTATPIKSGENIAFRLYLREINAWIRCTGKVVWVRRERGRQYYPEGLAIRFISLEQSSKRALGQYVSVRQSLKYIERLEARDRRLKAAKRVEKP